MSCITDSFAWSVNYEPLGPKHPIINDEWQNMNSPYDFNSIMQYDGTICQIGHKPVIAYKSTPHRAVVPNSRRMTSLDVFQVWNFFKFEETI